jgi:hypothetical protein
MDGQGQLALSYHMNPNSSGTVINSEFYLDDLHRNEETEKAIEAKQIYAV